MKKTTVIPLLLLIYLIVMSCIGFKSYSAGIITPWEYWGLIALTLLCIALLRRNLLRREKARLRREQEQTNNCEIKQEKEQENEQEKEQGKEQENEQ